MFDSHKYWIFVGAVVVLVLAPGPDMAYMLARTIAQGRKAGFIAAIGINVGAYVHVLAALLGLSAILATSSFAFTAVKWAGACYLVWIGVQALRNSTAMELRSPRGSAVRLTTIFWQGFLSDVLNPKVALFFLAFLPQFVDYGSGDELRQLIVLGVSGNVIAITINLALVYVASTITSRLRRNERITSWLQRATGVVFIGLGIRLAREKL